MHLRVSDVSGLARWYDEVLGFEIRAEDDVSAALGGEVGRPLVGLHGGRPAHAAPSDAAGLFHMAFLMPDRAAMAAEVRRILGHGWAIDGWADHNVSEAVYLRDPEGNGIEIYADRPPDVWRTMDGDLLMTTDPLDVEGLLMASSAAAPRLPSGTVVGHIHLRVCALGPALEFYHDRLGLDVTTRRYPGALFLGAGGYHHHVACNIWAPRAHRPRSDGSLGLMSFELLVPDGEYRREVLAGQDGGSLMDPDQHGVRIAGE